MSNMRSKQRKSLDTLYASFESIYRGIKYRSIARKTLKNINGGYKGYDKQFKTLVKPYWKKYGIKVNKMWYRLYCNENKPLDPRYIPNDMWFAKIIPYYNNIFFARALQDKCLFSLLLPGVKQPRTIVRNIAGVFYDNAFNMISYEEALDRCERANGFILKPSMDHGQGKSITFYDPKTMEVTRIKEIFNDIKSNFIVQEIVQQNEVLEKIHSNSLNTIRILSFFFQGEVHILSVIFRMGAGHSRIDNVSAGGLQCTVLPDGRLSKYALDKKRRVFEYHPDSGIRFHDIIIPSYDRLIELVKTEHMKIAHFRILGWDFAIDREGDPVFLEYNVFPGQNQMTSGPTFGDITDKVLDDVFIHRELKYSRN